MLLKVEKFRKIGIYLHIFYPVILFLYPLRHIRVGVEWWDTGYNYANFTYMEKMDEMWMFSTYLGNALGNLLHKLPLGDRMIGMNIYTGLFVSGLALMGYYFFVRVIKLPRWLVFIGEFLAVSLCWCPTALLYNYLTYFLLGVGYILLYQGLMAEEKKSRIYFVLAGIVLGLNVYTRFSNLAQMALIVAVWAMGIIRREKFLKVLCQTFFCVLGYVLGLGGFFVWIALRYGAAEYVQAILRLLQMPAEASSYTIVSMIEYQIRNYLQNGIWLSYFLLFAVLGMGIYKLFPKSVKWIAKIGYIVGFVLLLYYLRNQNMFNLKYSTQMSVFQWAVILLTVTWIAGLVVIFGRRFTEQEKLLCGMNIIMIVITPLGSNNHLYASINNLFLVAPFTLWMVYRFVKWRPAGILAGTILIKWLPQDKSGEKVRKVKVRLEMYPIKALIISMLVVILIQSMLFGWFYVFSEGNGGENLHTKIENSDILKGMLTSPDRAEEISTIAAYVEDNDLVGKEVILYGQIPAMSYYLKMPFAITPWPDLQSYNYEILEQDLAELEEEILQGEKELPVILLEIRQGSYLLEGENGLETLEISEKETEAISADRKLQLLDSFMKKYHYSKTFENTKFIMFQSNAERREEQ